MKFEEKKNQLIALADEYNEVLTKAGKWSLAAKKAQKLNKHEIVEKVSEENIDIAIKNVETKVGQFKTYIAEQEAK